MKGWELLKEIAEGNIKEGTIILFDSIRWKIDKYLNIVKATDDTIGLFKTYTWTVIIKNNFKLIEEEINIQDIERIDDFNIQGLEVGGYSMTQAEYLLEDGVSDNRDAINKLIKAIKQLDKQVKENK